MTSFEKPSITPTSTDSQPFNLWMEWGFSRREIAPRMQEASSRMSIISTPRQPVEGTQLLDLPSPKTTEGIDAINEAIEQNNINALWLQNGAHYDTSGINTEVHVAGTPDTIALVDDKIAFTEWLGEDQYAPFAVEANGVDAIREAYQVRHDGGHEVAIKPVIGVNGEGYWRLSEERGATLLNNPSSRTMHPEVYLETMKQLETEQGPQRMIMMDYLPGPEVSVDLLSWKGEPLSHAARTKVDGLTQRITSEHDVLEHSHLLVRRLGLHGIISLQYRLDDNGDWKILEINPRPAGGSIHSEDAGFGIITDWTKLVTGEISPNDVQQRHGDVTMKKQSVWHSQAN